MKPWTIEYVESDKCLLLTLSNHVTGEDILDAQQGVKIYVNQGKQISSILSDWSGVTKFDVYKNDVEALAKIDFELAELLPNICFATVAPDPTIFGTARSWQVYTQATNWTTEVLKTIDQAKSWLKNTCPRKAS